ncbi:MAG: iron-containing alcohol dehydrogenase [Candidatus Aenigmarchaeota archaeon]|nr:iron-containing alcohol dehydrogenase [Candidatus Aenigmarchaeota archaeon]
MEPHSIELPRKILMGKGVSGRMLGLCKELRIMGRPLVLADSVTKGIAGDRVFQDLRNLDARMEIVKEATIQEVARISRRAGPIDAVISVGGGSVIDVGKAVAFRKQVDFICVPTAPSHDGIISATASLLHGRKKVSVRGKMPLAIVADTKILKSAPKRLIASGYADAVSNITAVYDWKLARKKGEYYSEYAAELGMLAAKKAMRSANLIKQGSERGVRNLMEALITSSVAMTMAGSSRPASGAEHAISHVLDSMGSRALHGEQCGVASIVTACLQGQDWWKIRKALKDGGAPTTAKELGVGRQKFLQAIVKARNYRERYTILNEKNVDLKKAEKACKDTGVC